MLQDLTQTPNVPDETLSYAESAVRSAARPAAPPDRFANQLMDEIFGDVEDVLDGGFVPPQEPVKMEMPAPEIKFDVAAALAERYPQLAKHLEEGEALPDLPGPTTALATPKEKAKKKEKDPNGLSLVERFMILTGCTSAVAALGIWMTSQGLLGRFGTVLSQQAAPTAPAPAPALDASQTKFADYMARSLAAIDRTAGTSPAAPTSALPAVPVAGVPGPENKPVASSSVGIVLPKPGTTTASTNLSPNRSITPITIQPQPLATNPDTVSRTEFNRVNQMLQKISGMLERIAPGSSSRIPGLGNRSAAAPKVVAAAAPIARPAVAAPAANLPQRTMTSYGVVPNGNSFVMFDTNGVTQRVTLGENVGSTGWTLIDVTQSGVATFRRNGEIRNVAQGEKI
ncbi:MAG: hypothetical protein HC860_09180 [Alkalinema sp. RU_4_3]|nr:hypothetical protein [Alkalinema sp. RU_4_3]